MFKNVRLFTYAVQRSQDEIEKRINEMPFYYLLNGTKKDLQAKYGFSKETLDKLIRITKVGWKCFQHEMINQGQITDRHNRKFHVAEDQLEVVHLIKPPVFGYAVLESDVPEEIMVAMLDDNVIHCRLIEDRSKTLNKVMDSFNQQRPVNELRYKTETWTYGSYQILEKQDVVLSKESIDHLISSSSLHDLIYIRNWYALSILRGTLSAEF